MKKHLLLVMLALAVAGSQAQMLDQGTMAIDLEGNFDHKSAAGSQVWTGLGFGYFPIDKLELIAAGYFLHDDYDTGYHPALGAQYHVDLGCRLVPFVGVNLGWGIWDHKDADDQDGFVYGVEAGLKYYLTDNLAVSAAFDYDWSTGDLWSEKEGQLVDNNWGLHWGLRFSFKPEDLHWKKI